jgi:ABC-type arginine transport system permease subunit
MKLSSPLLSFLLNFLLGVSWAFALSGASIVFYRLLDLSLIYAIFASLFAAIPGLFFVLLIEYFFMREESLNEAKRQTKLLEELVNK